MRKTVWITGGIALVVIVGAAGFMLAREQRISASECALVSTLDEATRTPIGTGDPITVVGDSYSHGFGLDDPRDSWVSELGRQATVHASSSAGFTKTGLCDSPSLTDMLSETADGPVIVQGGLNDVGAVAAVQDAAETALGSLDGPVILVGPVLAPGFDDQQIRAVDSALARAADDLDITYVSAVDWPLDFADDGIHLSPEGHAEFGRQVRSALG